MGENRTVPTHVLPPPIRIIPSHTSIRQFSGSETDYTARQFLDLCELAIISSSITEDHDKIAFIRSCLMPGSRALNLMQSSAFAAGDIGVNYDIFKKNFIKIFGGGKAIHCKACCPHSRYLARQCFLKAPMGLYGHSKPTCCGLYQVPKRLTLDPRKPNVRG